MAKKKANNNAAKKAGKKASPSGQATHTAALIANTAALKKHTAALQAHTVALANDAADNAVVTCVAALSGNQPDQVRRDRSVGQNGVQNLAGLATCINDSITVNPLFDTNNGDITMGELVSGLIADTRDRHNAAS